jgi:hypothetical protein
MTASGDVETTACLVCGGSRRARCDFCGGTGKIGSALGVADEGRVTGVGGGWAGFGGGGGGVGIGTRQQNSSLAIASLVLGIASWVGLSLFASIPAVITGHMAKNEIKQANGELGGDGMATAGLVAGYANIALSILFFGAILSMLGSVFGG